MMGTPVGKPAVGVATFTPPSEYRYVVAGTAKDGSEIRKFADANLASAIDDVVKQANLGPGDSGAIVGYTDFDNVYRGAVLFKKELLDGRIDVTFAGVLSHYRKTGETKKEAGLIVKF